MACSKRRISLTTRARHQTLIRDMPSIHRQPRECTLVSLLTRSLQCTQRGTGLRQSPLNGPERQALHKVGYQAILWVVGQALLSQYHQIQMLYLHIRYLCEPASCSRVDSNHQHRVKPHQAPALHPFDSTTAKLHARATKANHPTQNDRVQRPTQ
jgi:hypothetical protein